MSKNLLLAGLVFATGCVVVTYDARNSASDQFTISGSQPLSYQLKVVSVYKDQIPELKNEYSQIVNKVLERHQFPVKQVESMEDAEEQHLEIRVYIKRNEASPRNFFLL